MFNKKVWFSVIILVLMIGGGFWFWQRGREVKVEVVRLKRQKLTETVNVNVKTDSFQKDTVFAPFMGIIQKVFLAEGSLVKAGNKIAVFDKTSFELAKNQAWAQYASAKSAKEQAFKVSPLFEEFQAAKAAADSTQFILGQAQKTFDDNPTDAYKSTLNTAYAGYQTAWSKVKRLQSRMINELQIQSLEAQEYAALSVYQKAQSDLKKTEITASQDGTLIYEVVPATGKTIKAGGTVVGGQPLFVVADLTKPQFVADLDETDFNKVKVGQTAKVSLDAYPDLKLTGQVDFIAPAAHFNATGDRAIEVRIKLTDSPRPFDLGLSGNAWIAVAEESSALTVPQDALFFEKEADWVWVVREGRIKKQKVSLGKDVDGKIEVLKGLSEGDLIVVSPVEGLKGGQKVKVSTKPQ